MPRRRFEDEDEYIRRKMRKLQRRLRRSRRTPTSNSYEPAIASPVPSLPEDGLEPLILAPDPGEDMVLEHIPETEPLPGSSVSVPGLSAPNPEPSGLTINSGISEPIPVASESIPEENLDEEILELLGATPTKKKKFGQSIQKDLALRWEHITTSGLSKEVRKDLLEKHLIPENCLKLAAPILNAEIKAALTDTLIGKDRAIENKQNQLGSAISCIGEALTKLFSLNQKEVSVIKPLLEAAQIMCDLQFADSMKRRSFICASIKKEIKAQLYETEIDSHLFGEKLAETLKAAKAINKSGSEIKVTTPRPPLRPLNMKPPLANSRQPAKRSQPPAVQPRASAPPAPPPAPRRRAPAHLPPQPPPPPPQRSQQRHYQRR